MRAFVLQILDGICRKNEVLLALAFGVVMNAWATFRNATILTIHKLVGLDLIFNAALQTFE